MQALAGQIQPSSTCMGSLEGVSNLGFVKPYGTHSHNLYPLVRLTDSGAVFIHCKAEQMTFYNESNVSHHYIGHLTGC